MAVPTAENIILQLALGLNTNPGEEQLGFNYESAETANRMVRIPFEIAASGVDTSIDLSQFVDSLKWVFIIDRSNIGLKHGKASGAGKTTIRAGAFAVVSESSPYTIYLDNLSASDAVYGEIIIIGSSA